MRRIPYTKYFRVCAEDIVITEISTNDFRRPIPCNKTAGVAYTLRSGNEVVYLYTDIGQAMEKAKDCAQDCIELLIAGGKEKIAALLQYRMDHYGDLHINLVDANSRKTENEMKNKSNFQYKPYKIQI